MSKTSTLGLRRCQHFIARPLVDGVVLSPERVPSRDRIPVFMLPNCPHSTTPPLYSPKEHWESERRQRNDTNERLDRITKNHHRLCPRALNSSRPIRR